MSDLTVSVVIVSYDRPDDLELCLKSLAFQYHRNFEVIVVHNSSSRKGLDASGLAGDVKSCLFEDANISAARNLGIDKAAGEIVAFIDDDAIAEPTWLQNLMAPFADIQIAAAGGYVIGRNGFDVQWGAEVVDDYGEPKQIEISKGTVIKPSPNVYGKTHGTNCAFRRRVLEELGGFDVNYHFFLDETDLDIRIGKAGKQVAIVPNAMIQHKFSESRFRAPSRAPKSLFQIGASTAYFLKKFSLPAERLMTIRAAQDLRLRKLVIKGLLEPRDVHRLLDGFDRGVQEGAERKPMTGNALTKPIEGFRLFRPDFNPKDAKYLSCRRLSQKPSRKRARELSATGHVTTLMIFSWTSWRHRRGFHRDGYWFQSGGLFGKSSRSQKFFSLHTLSSRTCEEIRSLRNRRERAKDITV